MTHQHTIPYHTTAPWYPDGLRFKISPIRRSAAPRCHGAGSDVSIFLSLSSDAQRRLMRCEFDDLTMAAIPARALVTVLAVLLHAVLELLFWAVLDLRGDNDAGFQLLAGSADARHTHLDRPSVQA